MELPESTVAVKWLYISIGYTCSLSGREDFIVVFREPETIRDLDGNALQQTIVKLKARRLTYMSEGTKKALEAAGSSLSVASILALLMILVLLAFQYWW